MVSQNLPLSGLRVLDLTRALAGPFCTTILGDLGADVVKVESLPAGDMTRNMPPFQGNDGVFFLSINRNKRSLALDFRKPEAHSILQRLISQVDVLVENFKPGVMDEMGLSYESLQAHNPRLIFASVTGFGRSGPYGTWPGLDQIAQGMSGFMSMTGQEPLGATRAGLPIGDLAAGLWIANGIQACVIERMRTGRGQRVETSLLAGLVAMLCVQGQRYLSLGEVPGLAGNHHPVGVPYGVYQAKDGPFNLGAAAQDMWVKLCSLIERPDLVVDPRFAKSGDRLANRVVLEQILNERFRTRTQQDWIQALVKIGIPAGPIYDLEQTFADPQVRHCRMVEEITHPTLGALKQLASPLGLDAFRDGSIRIPPPLLGQHNREILREAGYNDAEIFSFENTGTVGSRAP